MRLAYRVRQFGQYLKARLTPAERERVAARLGPRLAELFARMTPAEQAHCYRVAQSLVARGQTDDDLLIAALLHDVGKAHAPLQLWERTVVVLGRKLAPGLAERLGRADEATPGLGRAFVTAQQHAAWGAELAERAGAPSRAAALIRRHQNAPPTPPRTAEDRLLAALREADEKN